MRSVLEVFLVFLRSGLHQLRRTGRASGLFPRGTGGQTPVADRSELRRHRRAVSVHARPGVVADRHGDRAAPEPVPAGHVRGLGRASPCRRPLAMTLFAYGVGASGDLSPAGWLRGLKLVAVAVVAQAVWGMARSLAPERERASVAVAACLVCLAVPSSLGPDRGDPDGGGYRHDAASARGASCR